MYYKNPNDQIIAPLGANLTDDQTAEHGSETENLHHYVHPRNSVSRLRCTTVPTIPQAEEIWIPDCRAWHRRGYWSEHCSLCS